MNCLSLILYYLLRNTLTGSHTQFKTTIFTFEETIIIALNILAIQITKYHHLSCINSQHIKQTNFKRKTCSTIHIIIHI